MSEELRAKDAERARKPKLPKKRMLKKRRKRRSKSPCAFNGTENTKPMLKSVKFCPKCGSTNVFWASGLPQLWSIWECRNCGYRGPVILEDSKLAEKLRARARGRGD